MIFLNILPGPYYFANILTGYDLFIFSIIALFMISILQLFYNRIPNTKSNLKEFPIYHYKDALLQESIYTTDFNYIPTSAKVSFFTKLTIFIFAIIIFLTPLTEFILSL